MIRGFAPDDCFAVTGETTEVRENGATTGIGVLATYAYDNLGSRVSTTFGNGVVTSYGYDPVSRLTSLGLNFTGTANDLDYGDSALDARKFRNTIVINGAIVLETRLQ